MVHVFEPQPYSWMTEGKPTIWMGPIAVLENTMYTDQKTF